VARKVFACFNGTVKKKVIISNKQEVLKWGENHLLTCSFPRKHYRELIELTVVYLGGKVPPSRIFYLRKPGAHHRARFMHIAIYALKMKLMSERF
jgi:hypothetical protein